MIRRVEIEFDGGVAYSVRAIDHEKGPLLADGLTRDEALGVVASWIYRGPHERLPYLSTPLQEALWYRRYNPEKLTDARRQVLLAAGEPLEEPEGKVAP